MRDPDALTGNQFIIDGTPRSSTGRRRLPLAERLQSRAAGDPTARAGAQIVNPATAPARRLGRRSESSWKSGSAGTKRHVHGQPGDRGVDRAEQNLAGDLVDRNPQHVRCCHLLRARLETRWVVSRRRRVSLGGYQSTLSSPNRRSSTTRTPISSRCTSVNDPSVTGRHQNPGCIPARRGITSSAKRIELRQRTNDSK